MYGCSFLSTRDNSSAPARCSPWLCATTTSFFKSFSWSCDIFDERGQFRQTVEHTTRNPCQVHVGFDLVLSFAYRRNIFPLLVRRQIASPVWLSPWAGPMATSEMYGHEERSATTLPEISDYSDPTCRERSISSVRISITGQSNHQFSAFAAKVWPAPGAQNVAESMFLQMPMLTGLSLTGA